MTQYQRAQCDFVQIILSLSKMVMLCLLILGVALGRIRPVDLRTKGFLSRAISSSLPSGSVLLSPENQLAVINVICFVAFLRLEELLNSLNDICLEAKSNIIHKGEKETN